MSGVMGERIEGEKLENKKAAGELCFARHTSESTLKCENRVFKSHFILFFSSSPSDK
jgi:hypothetical protein